MRSLLALLAAATVAATANAYEPEQNRVTVATQTVQLRTVHQSGRPPYKRRTEELQVVDAAAIEVEAGERAAYRATESKLQGRPPYKRHH